MATAAWTALDPSDRVFNRVREIIGGEQFGKYLDQTTRIVVRESGVDVLTDSAFSAEWVRRHFGAVIEAAAMQELMRDRIEVRYRGDAVSFPAAERARNEAAPAAARPVAAKKRPPRAAGSEALRHKLDDFIVGESNRLAHAAALRLIDEGPTAGVSPLFIHGVCGVGKTHLLQGIAARFRAEHPGSRALYTTGEAFTNGFITALRENRIDAFRSAHRGVDLLCIDDVHFLAAKSATQTEFLHTFNTLGLEGARIALVSDEHPSRVRAFSRELTSRFVSGMVVQVEPPDAALRASLCEALARRRGLPMDAGAVRALSAVCADSVRELEGALTKLEAVHRLLPCENGMIDAGFVRRTLGHTGAARPRRPIRVETIVRYVAEELRVELADVLGRGRHKRVVLARSVAAGLARRLTTCSYPEIARALGRPSHSTVVSAVQRLEAQIERDELCGAGPDLDSLRITDLMERLTRGLARTAQAA